MAQRRMFSKLIIDSDAFLEMPSSTQCLYFHLSMRADDDGFLNNPRKIQRMIGCSEDDFKILVMKNFIIIFDSGICVIKHWRIHNYIQKDRYKGTLYEEEKSMLGIKENGSYKRISEVPLLDNVCIQDVSKMDSQDRLGKDRLEEELEEDIYSCSYTEIISYLNLKANTNYKTNTKKTKDLIKARLNEKFTIEDFKSVINKKCKEWLGTDMAKYLRPETLFGNKFESYLNQKEVNVSGNRVQGFGKDIKASEGKYSKCNFDK